MIAVKENGKITRYLTIVEWVKISEQPVIKPGWYLIATPDFVTEAYAEKSLDFLVEIRQLTPRPITWSNGIELSKKELSELVHNNSTIFYNIREIISNYREKHYVVYAPEYYASSDELIDGPIRAREHYNSMPIHKID